MALPANYKWRKGDKVTISGVVKYDHIVDRTDVWIDLEDLIYDRTVSAKADAPSLTLVQPHLEIGDMVHDRETNTKGKLVGLHGSYGWIELSCGGQPIGARIGDLYRQEPAPEQLEPPVEPPAQPEPAKEAA